MSKVCAPFLDDVEVNEFIAAHLGQCAYGGVQIASVYVGLSSIGCWLFAQTPQLLINYRLKTAESLSFYFLLAWILGDSTNLVGCLLTGQNMTQTLTAVYFVFMDIVLFSQYVFYQHCYHKAARLKKEKVESVPISTGVLNKVALASLFVGLCFTVHFSGLSGTESYDKGSQRVLLQEPVPETWEYWTGSIIGWISAILYLASRVPQIVKNIQRRSTEGLSPLMFTMAVMGNLTYSISIFMFSQEPAYLLERLPWVVGSLGTLFFDFTTLIQFFLFRKNIHLVEIVESVLPLLGEEEMSADTSPDLQTAYSARIEN